jgi:hypothetical protein
MFQASLFLLLLSSVVALLAAATAAAAAGHSSLFVQVTDQLEPSYKGSYRAALVVLPTALNVTIDANITVLLPAGSLLLMGNMAGEYSWATLVSRQQWLRIRGGDGYIDGTVRSICSSSRPLLIFGYINGYEDQSYVTVTDAVHQWQRVPLTQQPPIGYFTDTSCVIGSGGRVYWFFGLQNNAPPALPNTQVWLGQVSDAGGNISIDWRRAADNNTLAGRYAALTGVHRHNPHLNGSDVLYVVDGFVSNRTNTTVEERPVSQIAASLDGVHWYPLSVPWTSHGPVQEALAISDSGVIMWTDTASALYVSLDGGLTFGLCTDSPPFGERNGASTAFDQDGTLWLAGGFDHTDLWRSTFSWNDYQSLAQACGLVVPKDGIGLSRWPPANVNGQDNAATRTD